MKRYFGSLVLGAALFAPAILSADPPHRYYDRDHKDWHEWNEREDSAYRRYLQEQRRENREWAKANRKQQREYWKWRHSHPE